MVTDLNTIFAPATAVSESSITVIRISGKDTFRIVSQIFSRNIHSKRFEPEDITAFESHKAVHGYIIDGREVVDEVILTMFRAPNSFTGEDIAEISMHGGFYLYQRITRILLELGLHFAEPGEFSKRAYLNGKMDLVQAEAIADIIKSRTELARKAAIHQLTGEFSSEINSLKKELIDYCSMLELELDFSEEDIDLIDKQILIDKLDRIIQKVENMTRTYESGRLIKDGINMAIVGKPNTGKSSIFNYLLKENRAIVSELPGTTRDYLQEKLIIGGFVYNLVDTAGIRETINQIEKEGVKRSYEKVTEADILIEVISLERTEDFDGHFENSENYIKLFNKIDLVNKCPENELCVSALTGENMDKLRSKILENSHNLIYKNDIEFGVITNERHRNKLLISCEYLVNAKKLIVENRGNELISLEIRSAMDELNEIIGRTTNVDILNNIFSKFCIGK